MQITKGPGHNWQPDWSPDGKYIAYRSEDGEGGLFVVPALGGARTGKKNRVFWISPSLVAEQLADPVPDSTISGLNRIHVVDLDGSAPREIAAEFLSRERSMIGKACCLPHGIPTAKELLIWIAGEWAEPQLLDSANCWRRCCQVGDSSGGRKTVRRRRCRRWARRMGARFQVLLGAFGKGDLFRAHISRRSKHLEDDRRSGYVTGHSDRASDHRPRA